MEHEILQKFEKQLNFIKQLLKLESLKFITIRLTLETMQKLNIKPWRRSLGPWCQKLKIQND